MYNLVVRQSYTLHSVLFDIFSTPTGIINCSFYDSYYLFGFIYSHILRVQFHVQPDSGINTDLLSFSSAQLLLFYYSALEITCIPRSQILRSVSFQRNCYSLWAPPVSVVMQKMPPGRQCGHCSTCHVCSPFAWITLLRCLFHVKEQLFT